MRLHDFLNCSGGSEDTLFGLKVFGSPHFDKAWFKSTVWPAYRVGRRLHDVRLWFRVRCLPKYRHHIVKTELRPGWHDCDQIMLHANMALLCRYVEWECGGAKELEKWTAELNTPGSEGHGPREAVVHQASRQSEALALYHWWKIQRPADQARYEFLLDQLFGQKHRLTWKPVEGGLSEAVFEKFTDDEEVLHTEFRDLEAKIHDDEQTMLHRLIDIRPSLWT